MGAVIFLSSKIPTWAATSCRGRSDCPSGYECVYLDESGVPRLDSTNSANNAFCARIYQGVTSMPTRGPTPGNRCNTLFWFDDNNLVCGKKEFCGKYIYQGLRTFTTIEECRASLPKPKYAKEGEFCGAGPKGVVQCEPGLKCDYSRNRINEDSSQEIIGEREGAGGVCVKDISTVKPTIIDNCRLKVCGDANCDDIVNSLDLTIWKKESEGLANSRTADFNGDGRVDKEDYNMLQLGLEKKCGVPIPPSKYAKEGEFCGAGPNGVVECGPGLRCDGSRNFIQDENGMEVHEPGAGGICVKITPIAKPTIIDNCRLKVCGDANCDGKIDIRDRLAWFRERLRPGAKTADFNKDGKVDAKDYAILISGVQGKCKSIVPRVTVVPTRKPITTPISSTKYAKEGEFCGAGPKGVVQCEPGLRCDESKNQINYDNVSAEVDGAGGVCVKITPTVKKACNTNSDCQSNEYCYQPPMPTCPKGQNCLDVMPQKYCRSRTETSPIPTDRSIPTRAPTKEPVTKKFCETDSDCLRTETCYQPPLPTCPPGENCIHDMARKYCKPLVVSEVTGVEDKTICKESKGDANKDGKINLVDYSVWRHEYANGLVSKADFNCDSKVDITDYKIWREAFLETRELVFSDSN